MFYLIGFVCSLILIGYSSFKLWKDHADFKSRGRLWLEGVTVIVGFAGAVVSLLNGLQGGATISSLQKSLNDTQSYLVAAEEGRAPRSLSAEQQQAMIRDLKMIQSPNITLYWDATSVESKRYAMQIAYPFQQAGWRIVSGGNKFGVPDYAIYIAYVNGQESVANAARRAFEDVGLSPHVEELKSSGSGVAMEIDIGDKP